MIGPRFDEKEKYEKDEGIKLARFNKYILLVCFVFDLKCFVGSLKLKTNVMY